MNTWSWPQGCLNEAMLTEITANSINSSFGRNLKPQLIGERLCRIQIRYPLLSVIDCLKLCSFDAFGSNEASLQISPAYRIWPRRWISERGKRWKVLKVLEHIGRAFTIMLCQCLALWFTFRSYEIGRCFLYLLVIAGHVEFQLL